MPLLEHRCYLLGNTLPSKPVYIRIFCLACVEDAHADAEAPRGASRRTGTRGSAGSVMDPAGGPGQGIASACGPMFSRPVTGWASGVLLARSSGGQILCGCLCGQFGAGGDAELGEDVGQVHRRHCPASMTTTRLTDPRTCSQLSSTISSSRPASARTMPAIGLVASRSGTPSASATAAGTSAASVCGASSTSRAPSSKPPLASVATRSASRVLPQPPGPVNVTTRAARRPSRTAAISGPRPPASSPRRASPDAVAGDVTSAHLPSKPAGRQHTSYDPARHLI